MAEGRGLAGPALRRFCLVSVLIWGGSSPGCMSFLIFQCLLLKFSAQMEKAPTPVGGINCAKILTGRGACRRSRWCRDLFPPPFFFWPFWGLLVVVALAPPVYMRAGVFFRSRGPLPVLLVCWSAENLTGGAPADPLRRCRVFFCALTAGGLPAAYPLGTDPPLCVGLVPLLHRLNKSKIKRACRCGPALLLICFKIQITRLCFDRILCRFPLPAIS